MGHLPALIADLSLILIAGAVVTLIFRIIKQPLVLGYIIAGFIVGPHFSYMPTVVDKDNISTLAEIGVIFLLFSLGLEFSFKKLIRVGGSASITALVEIIFITVTGYALGKMLGWSTMDSLFLGGMLASSSTTIIIRAFEELGVKTKQFSRIVIGVLVVEDIVVILLMVLLSTIAVTQQFEGTEILFTVLKLLFFLALWFIAGIFLLPTFLKKSKKLLDEEGLLILSIALCLGMVVLAVQIGFSAELGAFIMGSIFAETTSAERIEKLIKPVRDLFGAVFFVSVGMMIDPEAIVTYKWPVIFVTLLTLFGKLFSTTLGALLSGQPLKQSIQVGMSMAQIGEFAFIVATLGLSLGVISDFLFPVAVGASAITTFTTPYLIKWSEPFYNYLVKFIPAKWVRRLNNYSVGTQKIHTESNWKAVMKSYSRISATNGIVLIALMLLSLKFLLPLMFSIFDNSHISRLATLVISLAAASPFLLAFMVKKPDTQAYKELWLDKNYNHGPLVVVEVIRILVGIFLIGFWVEHIYSTKVAVIVAIPSILLVLYIFSKRIQKFYRRIEGRFITNLNARERKMSQNSFSESVLSHEGSHPDLSPWDAHMVDLKVPQEASFIGIPLHELSWREQYGINIVYIKRGEIFIPTPSRNEVLLPFDDLGIIATDDQLQDFIPEFEKYESTPLPSYKINDIALQKLVVNEKTHLKGHTIRSSGIREQTHGLVVGIERGAQRILNPDSNTVFEWNDTVWIVGNWKLIRKFRAS